MRAGGQPLRFTVVQLGPLRRPEAEVAVGLANVTQRAAFFDFHPTPLPLDEGRYRLQNGGFDLDAATLDLLKEHRLPRPLIVLTAAPYGDVHTGNEPKAFYFNGFGLANESEVAIISTYLWDKLPRKRRLQPYLLASLCLLLLSEYAGMEFHDEARGCLCDYCENPSDIDLALRGRWLCESCERLLEARLKSGQTPLELAAAAKRLYNRALDRRTCFMVMPFKRELKPVYKVVQQTLSEGGWVVARADEIPRPSHIGTAIWHAIMTSELVVADLTGDNPNVFYEVGMAHAVGCDVILLTQERKIPFDVAAERVIRYRAHAAGLRALARDLARLAGTA